MTQAVIGACVWITSVTVTFYGRLRKLRYYERITSHWLQNITGVLKDMMSWRSVICRNLLKAVQAKMMIQASVITARPRSCLMSWKQHMSTQDTKGQEVKDIVLFVIHESILFTSSSLSFCFISFSHGSWNEKQVFQCYSTSDRPLFVTLWAVSIDEKDTETGISCMSKPFTLHEFLVPGRLDWYAVWTRWILLIHYELSKPFDKVYNSSSPEEQNHRVSGLSANGHLFCVWCPIHTAKQQWPRICEQNNTKFGLYVARNEASAWEAETFSKSRISWKIQPRCSRHAGCLDVGQQHENLVWRTAVYPKQEKRSSAFRYQDRPLWVYVWNDTEDRTWGFSAHWRHVSFNRNWRRTGTAL